MLDSHKYVIFTDSTSDLSQDIIDKYSINVIPIELSIDGKAFIKDYEISPKDFYNKIREGNMPKTTCINSSTYMENFEPILKTGKDILYIAFSGSLSSIYSIASQTATALNKIYPNNKVIVVDSCAASMGQGVLVYHAAKMKAEGKTLEEVVSWLEESKNHMNTWFTVNDLFHLKRGGRISATTAILGEMLNVKPIMNINLSGELILISKIRGRRAAILELLNKIENLWMAEKNPFICIAHADALEDASFLADKIKEKLGVKDVFINYITPVIGAHTGCGTVGVFFFGQKK
ncbi:MAG: DegV family protein [Clostridia bacterium]|nr:DegV family protein [Clostridia bacterium]